MSVDARRCQEAIRQISTLRTLLQRDLRREQAERERTESRYSDTSIKAYSSSVRSPGRHYAYRVPFNWPSGAERKPPLSPVDGARCAFVERVVFEMNFQFSAPSPRPGSVDGFRAPPQLHPARLGAVSGLYVR